MDEVDEFGIPIKKQQDIEVDEFGIPVKKKSVEPPISVSETTSSDTQVQDGASEEQPIDTATPVETDVQASQRIMQESLDQREKESIDFRREDGTPDLIYKLSKEEREAYDGFNAQKELSPDELSFIDNKIAEQKGGDFGVLTNAKNAIVNAPSFGILPNPFYNPANADFEVSEKKKLISEEVNRKQKNFLNDLDNPEIRKAVEQVVVKQSFRNNQGIQDSEFMINNVVLKSNELIENINLTQRNQKRLVEASKKVTTQAQLDEINKMFDENNAKLEAFQKQGSEFESQILDELRIIEENTEAIGTFEDEKDLLQRNYQSLSNAGEVIKLGFADVGAGLKFQAERAVNTFQMSPTISIGATTIANPAFDADAFEKKKEIEKRAIEERTAIGEFREFLEPSTKVSDVRTIGDAFDFAIEGGIENIPTLVQLASGVGQASFLLSQQAGNELDTRRDIAESKKELAQINLDLESDNLSNEERANAFKRKGQLEAQKDLTELNILATSTALAGAELVLGRIGKIRLLNKGKRVIASIGKGELATKAMRESIAKRIGKEVWDFTKDITGEFVEEGTQQGLENINQIFNFNIKFNPDGTKKKVTDGVLEAGLKGLATGTALSGSTKVLGHGAGLVTDTKRRKKVTDNVIAVQELINSLNSPDLEADSKVIIKEKITELLQENETIINNTITGFDNLSKEEKATLRSVNAEMTALNISLENIKKSKSLKNTSQSVISGINIKLKELDAIKEQLVYNNTPFNRIPKDDQVRFLEEAGDALIKEQQDAGNTSFSISENDTQEKAVELFNKEQSTTKPIKSDFDSTLYNNETGELTTLGQEIKAKIEAGEDVTILTAREDTQDNRDFIAKTLGIAPDKIKLGLDPQAKASHVNEGDIFLDDNADNVSAVSTTGAETVKVEKEEDVNKFGLTKTVTEETAEFVQDVAESANDVEDISDVTAGSVKVTTGDTSVIINSKGDNIVIESVSTKEGERGKGGAKKAVEKVVEVADEQGKTVELNVVPLDDGTTSEGLVTLYEGAGFVKDESFEETGKMVREPNSEQTFADIVESDERYNKLVESGEITFTDKDGKLCGKYGGKNANFTRGSKWSIVKDLKGYPSHSKGGVDIEIGSNGFSFKNSKGSLTHASHGLVLPKIVRK
jgi:hypothetical protein